MSVRRSVVLVAVVALLAATVPFSRPAAAKNLNAVPNQYIVVYKDSVGDANGTSHTKSW